MSESDYDQCYDYGFDDAATSHGHNNPYTKCSTAANGYDDGYRAGMKKRSVGDER